MGNAIRDAREGQRLTRKMVGDALKLTDQYIYQVETGRRTPTLETLWELAIHLGIDPHQLDVRLAPVRPKKR